MKDLLDQMVRRVLRHTNGMRMDTPLPRVGIGVLWPHTSTQMTGCGSGVCLVLQGAKQMLVGGHALRYAAGSCFASLIDLPTTRVMYEIEDRKPYVATSLKLDHDLLIGLLEELPAIPSSKAVASFDRDVVPRELLEAWDHHLALLDTPQDIPVLAASRERELLYRLIQSSHGSMLRQIAHEEGRLAQVRRAIEMMRRTLDQPAAVKTLAEVAGMSVPTFNRHFRSITGASPLQYQKTLRLQAARRLLAANMDATRAAFAVGYESPSQFSREYSRLFGLSPKRDAALLRADIGAVETVLI